MKTKNGLKSLGNSIELDNEFMKMQFAGALQRIRKVLDAEISRIFEDLRSGIHTCGSHPPSRAEDESIVGRAEQDK